MFMKLSYLFIILVLFILSVTADFGVAQTGYRSAADYGEGRFDVDAVDFIADEDGLNRLEVYYKIFYDALSYQKLADGYRADYEVSLIVDGKGDLPIAGLSRQGEIITRTYAETRRATDFIINMFSLTFEPQTLEIRIILKDKLAGTSREIKRKLKKRDYRSKYPTLSRIEFARETGLLKGKSKFNKKDDWVIPSITRAFGGNFDSMLVFYQEIYPGHSNEKHCSIVTRIYNKLEGFVYSDTVKYGAISEIYREVQEINLAEMAPGDYELEVRLEGRRGRLFDKYLIEFELILTAETIFRNDYDKSVEMLKYLATKEENKKFKEAKSSVARKLVWDEFWHIRDNDPQTALNPTKREYFRRIRHAVRYFSYMSKEGWKTTRGMVYIMYGEPDELDDYPFELSTKPYQIWYYNRLNPVRRFLFIDEWGDGDYELQPPYNGYR